jgi:hypothetical protein
MSDAYSSSGVQPDVEGLTLADSEAFCEACCESLSERPGRCTDLSGDGLPTGAIVAIAVAAVIVVEAVVGLLVYFFIRTKRP